MKGIDLLRKFLTYDKGAASVEYTILASAIAAVVVATVLALGLSVLDLFEGFSSLWSQYFPGVI